MLGGADGTPTVRRAFALAAYPLNDIMNKDSNNFENLEP